ncbi:MAG TPA: hypothetical protein VMR70_15115 [Flavisolibacter sp.]|nr:hypothetical protein [Flavisolibacter sp.]
MSDTNPNRLSEAEMNYWYEKAEMDLLRDGIKRTYKERFLFLMTLVKIQKTMSKMKVQHYEDDQKS